MGLELANRRDGGGWELTGFGRPFGLGQDREQRLLVTDMDSHRLYRFDPKLEGVQWTDGRGWSERRSLADVPPPITGARFNGPHAVSVKPTGPDGSCYVTTYYGPGVWRIDEAGEAEPLPFGATGLSCELEGPATACWDHTGRLWVAEYRQSRVLAFSGGGELVAELHGGHRGTFDRPHMCRAMQDGRLAVADTWHHRILLFDAGGALLGWLGGRPRASGWKPTVGGAPRPSVRAGAFHAPVAIGCRADGAFVVVDWGNDRLQIFEKEGRLRCVLSELGLRRPYDAQFLSEQLVIADSHHGRVLAVEEDV